MGAFNFYNLESLKSITKSADIKEKPVFAMVSEKAIEYAGLEEIIELTKAVKLKTKVDIYLHLDHGKDIELVKRCIKMGFDSVMFDGSALPIDQNIIISKDLCRIAHRNGVVFEAEIGRVGGKEDKVSSAIFKTDPRDAQKFFEEVKPDMLAVAIGNVHGPITANEELDFTLLAKIQDTIKAPLVLHGCSNRLPREYKVAISQGIVKINIDTELRQAFVRGVSTAIKKKISDPREILTIASDEMSEDIKEKIEIFSCEKLNC
ncbi:MAG: D-tagatose-1,6-bisphosphate aldolase subunit KbaY [candidate division WS2 bacterium ADurb.Bin280]|uniref:D-tagatose-1,6-bisphosphate aldolase subunit KbaY n=1 Tax=candidate division WS2 bacterium ADurb.Bin280 TaxID=1852829 RepID=A0A1V5SCJ3_9BACT|nr:MAG: D-tagatose-1,6-bisphosphate aldolase subunit KbaY [candidate division WS2 bacterium ADurb.Bin280]